MIYFFAVFYIAALLVSVYFLVRKEPKVLYAGAVSYFVVLTILFVVGVLLFDLSVGPIEPDRLSLVFAYLYVVPFILLIGYKLFAVIRTFVRWQMIILIIASLINMVILGYLLLLIFALIFQAVTA